MTEAQLSRAAKAISRTLKRTNGMAGPWSLARAALMAAAGCRETSVLGEGEIKSMLKVKRYRASNKKGWATRKRQAALRAAKPDGQDVGRAA